MEKNIPPSATPPSRGEADARAHLQAVARARGSSLAELSRLLGRNSAYLQQYVARGSPRHLDEPDMRRIAEFLGIDARTIATRPVASPLPGGPRSDWRAIPRLAIEASAGPGAVAAQEIPFDSLLFSKRWLLENGLGNADLSAIQVDGDSMEPILHSGDQILVDRNRRSGEGIFVVRIGDALHVKKVHASAPGTITLVSENAAYPTLDLPREEVEVIGRVVWKGGRVRS